MFILGLLSVKVLTYKQKSLTMMMMMSTYDADEDYKLYLSVKVFSIAHMLVLYGHIC